jgi:hypothetical protein
MKVIVANFEQRPVVEMILPRQMREITNMLPLTLDLVVAGALRVRVLLSQACTHTHCLAAKYVFDENYWKRRCVEAFGWHKCAISEHGMMWKQLFFEKAIQVSLLTFALVHTPQVALCAVVATT